MASLSELSGLGSGSAFAPRLSTPFFSSGTFVAPQDGIVELRAMGAGGSGAYRTSGSTTSTGGYSGEWGAKVLRVSKGQTLTVTVGGGGAPRTTAGGGNAGGNTTINVDGVDYIALGGSGGITAASGTPTVPNAAVISSLWHIGASSVKPGVFAGASTGGAGVDILAQGNNATTSASTASSGGGGTGFPGVGLAGGGALPGGKAVTGQVGSSDSPVFMDADNGDWLMSFYGGSGGISGAGILGINGANGGGGGSTTGSAYEGGTGGNGGGGGCSNGGGIGGIGAGGAAGNPSGAGGSGFAVIHFFTDSGV